ncbi:MAG: hypothetical protein C4567_05180 [Deltaproteobacteria bacterium]|nr:MAG: hypothetical protein C4567_05180 [Deltaproteobacteria bacterium]
MQVIYPVYRPSPLAGFSEGMNTLADAVIQSRERQGLTQDADLIAQAIAKAQDAGQPKDYGDIPEPGQTSGNLMDVFTETMPKMKTAQGRFQLVKLMLNQQPQPVYAQEGGELVRRGNIPQGAQILKPDPEAQEARKFERQSRLQEQKDAAAERRQERKEQWQLDLESKRQDARDAREWQRYRLMNGLLTRRLEFQEKIKDKASQKDRTEYARRELVNARQQAMKNYNSRVNTINKEFNDPFASTGKTEEEHRSARKEALGRAEQEYQEHLQLINDSYADVIEKYGIKPAGKGRGPGAGVKGQDVMESLPNPSGYNGKVARDTVTGRRFKSDGKQWVPLD